MNTDTISAVILDDSESEEEFIIKHKVKNLKESKESKESKVKITKPKNLQPVLKKCYNEDENTYEIGVDEVGRGPLFGRVYTAAVILPKDDSFDCSMVKDSKKYHSKKKIEEASQYVKDNALAWYISFEDEKKKRDQIKTEAKKVLEQSKNAEAEAKKEFAKAEKEIAQAKLEIAEADRIQRTSEKQIAEAESKIKAATKII